MVDSLVKVRVYYKNPIEAKSGSLKMRESLISWYRGKGSAFSPYKRIVRIK